MNRRRESGGAKARLLVLLLALVAISAIVLFRFLPAFGGRLIGARRARVNASPNFRDGRFRNSMPTEKLPGGMLRSLWLQITGREKRHPDSPIPIVRHAQLESPPSRGLRAMWIGHASVMVDIDGLRVLTDPIWSERCSPFQWTGPKRFHDAPVALGNLGRVDAVVISHDHYDHLDMATIRALTPGGTIFFVPLGIGAHLERWDVPFAQIRELDWNERAELSGVSFVALPVRHYSGRRLTDEDATLWASWAIIGPAHRVWFSGDSGFFDALSTIGAEHGPFDLTLIKIGAYGSTWPQIHMTPEEAVATHQAVRGKLMLPIHWGTFNLAFHDWYEPAERFVKGASGRIEFVVPRPGEIIDPSRPAPVVPWWRE